MAARPSAITAPTANHLTTILYFQRAAHQPGGPRNPTQHGNGWAASSRAIHVHFHHHHHHHLQRPDQDCRSSPAAPSSYRPTPWPSTHGQNWNCFLDVAAALRVLGAPAAYCRATIVLQVTDSEPSSDTDAHRPLKPALSIEPQFHENAPRTGACCRRKPDGSRKLPRVSRYCSPQSPVAPRGDLFRSASVAYMVTRQPGTRCGGTSETSWSHTNTSTTVVLREEPDGKQCLGPSGVAHWACRLLAAV